MKYNQVIVVEGRHDEQKIKSVYPGVECIVTNGSAISNETLNLIYETSLIKEVILFLDPDFPGKKITNSILQTNGSFKIAFINKENAKSKNGKKVGIEHANTDNIKQSLSHLFSIDKEKNNITIKDLMNRRLINHKQSQSKRNTLCKRLNIPVCNGKALLRILNLLNIKIEGIDNII